MMQARDQVLKRLEDDLVGPHSAAEVLEARPSDVYLSGILWPWESRMGDEEAERLGLGDGDSGADAGEAEELSLTGLSRPCSAGLSFALRRECGPAEVSLEVTLATYLPTGPKESTAESRASGLPGRATIWSRREHVVRVGPLAPAETSGTFNLASREPGVPVEAKTEHGVPAGLHLHVRAVPWNSGVLVTATLLNKAEFGELGRDEVEKVTLFQVRLVATPVGDTTLIARPVRRAVVDDEDRNLALLYRDAKEFAVGHTCSALWEAEEGGYIRRVATTWVPRATVRAVRATGHQLFEKLVAARAEALSATWLSAAPEAALESALLSLVETYRSWIRQRRVELQGLKEIEDELRAEGRRNLDDCEQVARRMEEGARFLTTEPLARRAFQLANRAMQVQYQWTKRDDTSLQWRPFQLGFILLAAASVARRDDDHRATMDLLWFPTGGGKTEAYLCLIAFISFYRRIAAPASVEATGVAAMMRYTLRLLTTQQFVRAAAMILACDAIRRGVLGSDGTGASDLGPEPFSIGLWVGRDATPNTFEDAVKSLNGDTTVSSPKQLQKCPACGRVLEWTGEPAARSV